MSPTPVESVDLAKPSPLRPSTIGLPWLVKLRWGIVAFELAALLGARYLGEIPLPMLPMLFLVLVSLVSNVALQWLPRVGERTMGAAFMLDTLMLTGLLYYSGGPANPFSALYLVHVTLASMLLPPVWIATVMGFAVLSYATLFRFAVALPGTEHAGHGAFSAHLQAMWVAFLVTAMLIAFFVARVSGALRRAEAGRAESEERAARLQRLASVTALAAGAAHELASPLATIAVLSKELERRGETGLTEDARLIRSEVDRCRRILDEMAEHAGAPRSESPQAHDVHALLAAAMAELGPGKGPWPVHGAAAQVMAPRQATVRAFKSVLDNASAVAQARVDVTVQAREDRVWVEVGDDGPGMPPEVLRRAGEPFFSTRESGMGLGLFSARTLCEQLGGSLLISSNAGQGTRVTLSLPKAPST